MRIYEVPWLLYLLLLVFVDQVAVTSCPNGCLGDGDTLTCKDINNADLPELYMCINELPNVAILDIRSQLICDCELLHLTNHHVNPDLIVFAPIECSTDVSVTCGYRQSVPAPEENLVEIAGKFFDIRRADLQDNLNKHLERLVQKVYKIHDPEKRLKYVSAVLMNTRDAIDKLRGVPTTTVPTTTTIATPEVTTPKNVLSAAFQPLWDFFKGHTSMSDTSKDSAQPVTTEPTITTTTPKNRLEAAFEPLWKFFKSHTSNSEPEKISTHPLKAEQENTNKAPYHIKVEPSGWKHFIEDQVTSTHATPLSKRRKWGDDLRLKYTIFGCIIIFIMLVIVLVLFAMTQNKRSSSNKPNKGDLDIHSYFRDNNIWNKMKGKVQTEYKRRSVDVEQKDKSVVITHFNMPKANLVNMAKPDVGVVAVSGLTTAIPQQPVPPIPPRSNKGKTESVKGSSSPTQTRLLYKTGLYPGSSDESMTILGRAVPSAGLIITKSADHRVNFGRGNDTTEKSKDTASSSNDKTDTSPGQNEPTPISSDEHVEKTLFMKNYGHKSGYSLTEDVKGTVKVYEPTKFTQDASARTLVQIDERAFEAVQSTDTRMSYADREKARLLRKKKLTRLQIFTG
ncbi:hypothetical protein SNE40_022695 [Patella caerulea]|uniref:Uncharacterized protein n=1 Tax=Patella caerulea TaxID=87958 RepID=A0AAN8G110_PATCE